MRTHALATRVVFEGRRASACAIDAAACEHVGAGAARGDPRRRPDQLAATAEAVRRRAGRGAARRSASRCVHDLPGVGENLQDHLEFYFQVACRKPITLYSVDGPAAARR